ncbi:MAG: peptidase [Cyanobacteria bacterium J06600_6]
MKSIFLSILNFELNYHLRRPTFWLIGALFFTIALTDIVSNASGGNAFFFINSPSQIFQTTIWYTIFGILAASAFVAETFVRDSNYRMESLILTTPIKKWNYLGTRFIAAFAITLMAFSAYLVGMSLGTVLPGLNPFALGAFRPDAYLVSYLLFAIPNLFIVSAIAFVLASKTRSMVITYAGAIILVMLYLASLMMLGSEVINFEGYSLWAILDPFGFHAFEETTFTWTVEQHNTLMPALSSTLIWNRLFWIGLSGIAIAWSYSSYGMKLQEGSPKGLASLRFASGQKAGGTKAFAACRQRARRGERLSPKPDRSHSPTSNLNIQHNPVKQWLYRSWFETQTILKGKAFILLTIFGLASLIMTALGTRTYHYSYPSTDLLVHAANIYLEYILFAIIIVYAAELIWRDRNLRLQDVIDATPVSNGVLIFSKLTALFVVITINLLLAMAVMVAYQAAKGYYDFEFPLYFKMLFVEHAPYFYFTAVLAIFTQVITRQKYAGMAVAIAISLSKIPLDALGWYHNLYRFGETNDIEYSLMNGYGRLLTGHLWYVLYWSLFSGILMMLAYIVWLRGTDTGNFIKYWQRSLLLASGKVKGILATLVVLFAGVGTWIFYNTNILNVYQPTGKQETAAELERRFKQYESLPMPVVTDTKVDIELYPDEGYFTANGEYQLKNDTNSPMQEIHLLTFVNLELGEVNYPGATLREAHPEWGYYIYDLATPLLPGESQTMNFVTRIDKTKGFRNQVDSDDVYMIYPNDVVDNGTNLYSPFILPFVGYTKMVEQKKSWLRYKLGLPPLEERVLPHNDPKGLTQGFLLTHLGWGNTDITIGTSNTQTPVSTGKLVKRWTENNRTYAQYKSTTQDKGKFTIYSADYAVHTNNNYRVPIEVYYHPQHDYNVELMAEEAGKALAFYEQTFGEYPFEQIRIVETSYYDEQLFYEAGTIGIPEFLVWKNQAQGQGKENVIDWVSYLLAQSWWEDRIMAADVAGAMSIREALSSYSSMLYQDSRRTPEEQRFAKKQQMQYYFRGLGKIDFKEPALTDVYNEFPIARDKGGMILEQVEDIIGQPALISAIKEFLEENSFQTPPYATIIDFKSKIIAKTKESDRPIIEELFNRVVTYQVGITDAVYESQSNGKYKITLDLAGQKLYTTELGKQDFANLDLPVTIALKDATGKEIYRQKHSLPQKETTLELTVDKLPTTAAIDPDYVLPSAFLHNNIKSIRQTK